LRKARFRGARCNSCNRNRPHSVGYPMQATTVSPPPPLPQHAPPVVAGTTTVNFTGTDGTTQVLPVPMTEQALRDLKSQRDQLSSQLTNVASRPSTVAVT